MFRVSALSLGVRVQAVGFGCRVWFAGLGGNKGVYYLGIMEKKMETTN